MTTTDKTSTLAKLEKDIAHDRAVSIARSAGKAQAEADRHQLARRMFEQNGAKSAIDGVRVSLREVARLLDTAADRAWTIAEEEERHRAAAQVRLMTQIAVNSADLLLAESWLDATRLYLGKLERDDMDDVHRSRSSRRFDS